MPAPQVSKLERHCQKATLELVLRIRDVAVTAGLQAVLREYSGIASTEWLCDVVFYRRFRTIVGESAASEMMPEVPTNDRRKQKQPRNSLVSAGSIGANGLAVCGDRPAGNCKVV